MSTIDHPLIERARTSRVPVADLVGFSIETLGDGRALGWLDAGPRHANPMGTVHGGILVGLQRGDKRHSHRRVLAPSGDGLGRIARLRMKPDMIHVQH